MNTYNLITGFAILNNLSYIFDLFIFLMQFVGLRYYIVHGDKEKTKNIIKKLEKDTYSSSSRTIGDKIFPSKYFLGWGIIGYYDTNSKYIEDLTVHIITSIKYYNKLNEDKDLCFDLEKVVIHDDQDVLTPKKQIIKIYNRSGEYKNLYYRSLKLEVTELQPLGCQEHIVKSIVDLYRKKLRANIFIYGVAGAGKSSVGYLLAKELNGFFCHTFNPTDPGDTVSNMITEISQDIDEDRPIIVVLEEANIMIRSIHTNTVRHIREIPTPVHNKTTWSNFLDDMVFYKRVILILTSNESKDDIDKLDESYLRKGRIDSYYSMMEPLDCLINTPIQS